MNKTMTKAVLVTLALSGVALGGFAFAEQGNNGKKGDGKNGTLSSEIEILEQEVANLSPEEKVERAVEKVDGMKVVLDSTSELLEKVRKEERDILKLNCINEKSAAIKGFVKVSEQSFGSLKTSVGKKDVQSQNHYYTLIAISGQKVGGLGDEARVCAGEVLQYSDGTVTEVVIDTDIAEFDYLVVDRADFDFEYAEERLPELTLFQ